MADAYATFAAQGVQAPAHLISKVVDRSGHVLYQAPHTSTRVLSPGVAADETYALQQPFEYGTAAGLSPGRPVAGKTGTTDGNVSAWLCGYAPQLASCVAVSRANHKQSLNGVLNTGTEATGASTAGHTWEAFMAGALAGQPILSFPSPVWGGIQRGAPPPPPPPPPTKAPAKAPTKAPGRHSLPTPQRTPGPVRPTPAVTPSVSPQPTPTSHRTKRHRQHG
jgi:membrane peptidoglycan carboxypeptidase